MPALFYLFVMFALGDAVGRRFYPFVSIPHRLASAFLCGLLLSSWWTYAAAYFFSSQDSPMLWGNLAFLITAGGLILWLRSNPPKKEPHTAIDISEGEFQRPDWIIAVVFLLFVTWMMFRTFTMGDGKIMIGHHQFPDYGSTLSIMQSFADGHNFPTQYTHFTGERIRYHFLFYFQAGNLEFLGLSPAVANNLLSIFSLTSLLLLVMTLGSVLFNSRIAGRIGAALFFFHGSLSFIPFVQSHPSFASLLEALGTMKDFLNSGFPYRGEAWGVWSQNVYLNQRHLASAIAIFLLILIYLVIRLREKAETETDPVADSPALTEAELNKDTDVDDEEEYEDEDEVEDEDDDELEDDEEEEELEDDEIEDEDELDDAEAAVTSNGTARANAVAVEAPDISLHIKKHSILVFSGVLLGLLPMWNGAVFLCAAVVLAAMFALFPRLRRELIALAVTAAIISIPQIIYLKTGEMKPAEYSMFHWGFVIEDAGIFNVLYWTFYTFGFKWVLLAIALYFASGLQRRFLAAISILLPLTYCFRFAEEVLANHKFINLWLVVINVFCGFALAKLWHLKAGQSIVPARVAAVILVLLVTIGGAIDFAPIKNSTFIEMKYDDNKLIKWVKENTDPRSIFLSHRYINHEILLAGRRLFYGDPYYAWGTDYDTKKREALVRTMLESQDPNEVLRLLKENDIDYVAIDDQIRQVKQFIKEPNEELLAQYFPVAFSDDSAEFGGHMRIYKVPNDLSSPVSSTPPSGKPLDKSLPASPDTNIFRTGTEGVLPGQFSDPRGLAVDAKGFIYVADYHNARVQKFAPDGSFVVTFGTAGDGDGEMKEPNSIVIDEAGSLLITDGLSHKLMKFDADGKFIKEWKKPAVDFYGARDLAFGPNKRLYIIDQGHTEISVFDPAADTFTKWGSGGAGDGQFNEATGIGIGAGYIFVADRDNRRIQVFDFEGKFIRQWPILGGWERNHFPDVVYDEVTKHVYVSNGKTNEILVFDVDGNPLPSLSPPTGEQFANPSAMVISETGKQRRLFVLNTDGRSVSTIELEAKKAEAKKGK
ncbi:MAG: 6-bladed beta-propeller [Pyrinomonadaceae bacterium]